MATKDADLVLRSGGSLCWNPTDLSIAFPHGGTDLGVLDDVMLKPMFETMDHKGADDRYTRQSVETFFLGESWLLGVTLRQTKDNDVLNVIFPNTTVGSVTGERYVSGQGSVRPGSRLSNRTGKLLFSPENPANKAAYFPKTMVMLEETAELMLMAINELTLQVIFRAMPDATSRTHFLGRLTDFTL